MNLPGQINVKITLTKQANVDYMVITWNNDLVD